MNNNTYLKNSTSNSLVVVPTPFKIILGQSGYQENLAGKKFTSRLDVREVFHQLPSQNIRFEQNQMDVLASFVSKLVNESKDLDGEIVDMVNRNFKKLLLKI